jgi:alkylglycerol monooxygenase
LAARFPKPAFDIRRVQRFDPPASQAVQVFAGLHFGALLGGVAAFLWIADGLPIGAALAWATALTGGLWCVGAVLQGRLSVVAVVLFDILALGLLFVN